VTILEGSCHRNTSCDDLRREDASAQTSCHIPRYGRLRTGITIAESSAPPPSLLAQIPFCSKPQASRSKLKQVAASQLFSKRRHRNCSSLSATSSRFEHCHSLDTRVLPYSLSIPCHDTWVGGLPRPHNGKTTGGVQLLVPRVANIRPRCTLALPLTLF
jgi:hypothetical protein